MPTVLLPASAAAFAPRSSPNVVLNSRVEPWLTQTLKRINRIKRPLNSVPQHQRCLTEILSGPNAIWTLCSLMLPKAPEAELQKDENPLVEALVNYQLIPVEAYVVHVDMVSNNEVAFKLTPETIESLIEYHRDVYSVDAITNPWNRSEQEAQIRKLQEDFVQAANKFVYRTDVIALEGLEEDGAGELLGDRSEEVKNAIMGLFIPLMPPPPRIVDVVRIAPTVPSSSNAESWWQPSVLQAHPAPVEPWRVVPSTPTTCSSDNNNNNNNPAMWADLEVGGAQVPSSSPPIPYNQPYPGAGFTTAQEYGQTMTTAGFPALASGGAAFSACGPSAAGVGGLRWDRYPEVRPPYGTIV